MSGPREKAPEAAPQSGGRCAGGVGRGPVILSLLFSLLSVGACFLLSAKTSKLQGRLVALEEELASRAWSPGEQLAAEPLLVALQPQVDDLLREVRAEKGGVGDKGGAAGPEAALFARFSQVNFRRKVWLSPLPTGSRKGLRVAGWRLDPNLGHRRLF